MSNQDGRTHSATCWREHHDCARERLERLTEKVEAFAATTGEVGASRRRVFTSASSEAARDLIDALSAVTEPAPARELWCGPCDAFVDARPDGRGQMLRCARCGSIDTEVKTEEPAPAQPQSCGEYLVLCGGPASMADGRCAICGAQCDSTGTCKAFRRRAR